MLCNFLNLIQITEVRADGHIALIPFDGIAADMSCLSIIRHALLVKFLASDSAIYQNSFVIATWPDRQGFKCSAALKYFPIDDVIRIAGGDLLEKIEIHDT